VYRSAALDSHDRTVDAAAGACGTDDTAAGAAVAVNPSTFGALAAEDGALVFL
jgi:hypothetical protein